MKSKLKHIAKGLRLWYDDCRNIINSGGVAMNYRLDKYGNKLSVLGFGCMRFQQKMGKIDMEKAEQQIMTAFQNGVNYYDTAYIYSGSEAAIGEIFEKNGIRDQINIATRLPHYLIKSRDGLDKLFAEKSCLSIQRCRLRQV